MANKVYDLSKLEELAGGNTEFVDSMVETFLEHTPGQLQEMLDAHQNGDMKQLGATAHKIKPNIELFGILEIKKDIRVVEELGKAGTDNDELKTSLAKVNEYLNKAFNQLQQR